MLGAASCASKVFAGNVREHRTLAGMLEALEAPAGALVVMDRGRHRRRVTWLRRPATAIWCQPRTPPTPMPPCRSRRSRTRPYTCTRWSRPTPTLCACSATPRSGPTRSGASSSVAARFETALTKLNDGLARPRAHKGSTGLAAHRTIEGQAPRTTRSPLPPTRPATRPSPSPGPAASRTARWLLRASIACAAARPTGTKTPCGVTTPRSPTWRPSLPQIRRPASHLPPQAGAGRRPPVHHCHPLQVSRLRAHGEHASWTVRRVLEGQQRVMRSRRPHARAYGHPSRTRSAGHLPRAPSTHTPAAIRKTLV